jgi:hypothetical protein
MSHLQCTRLWRDINCKETAEEIYAHLVSCAEHVIVAGSLYSSYTRDLNRLADGGHGIKTTD